jgi:hypothetical protein
VKILAQYKPSLTAPFSEMPIHDTTNWQRYKKSRTVKRQAVQEFNKVAMDGIRLAISGRHWEVVKELLPFVDI